MVCLLFAGGKHMNGVCQFYQMFHFIQCKMQYKYFSQIDKNFFINIPKCQYLRFINKKKMQTYCIVLSLLPLQLGNNIFNTNVGFICFRYSTYHKNLMATVPVDLYEKLNPINVVIGESITS